MKQYYIPVMEEGSNRVLGVLNLQENVEFTGTETEYLLDSGITVNLTNVKPTKFVGHKTNKEFMAVFFTRTEVRQNAHKGFPEYVDSLEMLPSSSVSVSSGVGTQFRNYNGPLIDGLEGNFAAGLQQHDPV